MSSVIKLILNGKDETTFDAKPQLTLLELMEMAIAFFPR